MKRRYGTRVRSCRYAVDGTSDPAAIHLSDSGRKDVSHRREGAQERRTCLPQLPMRGLNQPVFHAPATTRERMSMDRRPSLVARWLAAGDSGAVEAFDDLLHRDVVVHAPRGLSTEDLEAEKQVWREALAAMPDLRHEVQEVVVQGNVEMARVIVSGTMRHEFAGVPGSGRSFRMDQAVICHLAEGKIAEACEIADGRAVSSDWAASLGEGRALTARLFARGVVP
jgi:ketosteroid isomerase-like protein